MRRWLLAVSQQGYETRLFEVPVKGQGFLDLACFHDDEACAVGDAPALVQPRQVTLQGGLELGAGLGHDLYVGSAIYCSTFSPARRRSWWPPRLAWLRNSVSTISEVTMVESDNWALSSLSFPCRLSLSLRSAIQ